MASAAIEGFVTGFAGTLAENVLENKKRARDYFDKQVEYARTTGLQNRQRVRQQVEGATAVARQLEQVGVPREVIMAQINQNPDGVESFYEQAEKIRAKAGRDLTPEEWKAIYKVAGDFKAPDEDIATFISRTYDPIANAAASPDFEEDPEGSLISTMMGFNAMDRARRDLAQTEIADGMTADQLIRYGDVTPQRVGGNAVVTVDYAGMPPELRDDESELSITETNSIVSVVEEEVNSALSALESEGLISEGADVTETRDDIVEELRLIYPSAPTSQLKLFVDRAIRKARYTVDGEQPATDAEEAPTEPLLDPATTPAPTATDAPTEAPTASTGDVPLPRVTAPNNTAFPDTFETGDGVVLTLVRVNDNGLALYMDQDGNEYELAAEAFQ